MRVLLVGPQWVARWTESTQKALANLGHDVQIFYYNSLRVEQLSLGLARRVGCVSPSFAAWLAAYQVRWERAMNRRLSRLATTSHPDLILVLKGETLETDTVASLQRAARNCLVTWWLDDPLHSRLSQEAIRIYDAVFLFDRSYFEPLSQVGAAELHFLPCCCDPDVFRPMPRDASFEVTFVGVYYANRGQILERMAGLNVGIWGPQWDNAEARQTLDRIGKDSWRGKFADPTMAVKIHNASKVCLNVHHPQTRIGGLNLRTFEVLACSAFLLTDYIPGIEEMLVPGVQVACYSSPDQVRSRVDYYLNQPAERARIGERGRARVLREHTYLQRMKTMLAALNLST